jgi:hypothetical protein
MAARTSHVMLSAIVSLAVGFLLGSMWAGRPAAVAASASPGLHAPAEGAVPRELEARPSALASASAFDARLSVSAAEADLPELPAPELEDASDASGAAPLATSGSSRLVTGAITTFEGAPIAGVELELEPPEDAPKYRKRHTTSDASGRFAFANLPRGVWRVTGRHSKYVLQRRSSFPQMVPTGADVAFLATPAVPVEVRVTGPDVERARVAFRRPGDEQPTWSPWTNESTILALSPGAWELCASVDALEDWPSDRGWKLAPLASPVTVVHVASSSSELVTLALERTHCLYGRVQFRSGMQAGDSSPSVRLIETLAGTVADFETEGDRLSRSAELDAEGRYGFFALPYPRWTAGVASSSWSKPSDVEVAQVDGMTPLDLEQSGDGEECVLVEAFTASGERVTAGIDFNFLHRNAEDKREDYVWRATRTVLEADGALRVIAVPLEKDAHEKAAKKRELVLRATLAGFAQIEQPIGELDGERVQLSFAPGASLELLLVGEGAERAMRRCYANLQNDEHGGSAGYDEAARALKFNSLNPGTYTLNVMVWGQDGAGNWRQVQLHKGEVVVRAGAQQMVLDMPERAELIVRCPEIKKDTYAMLYGPLQAPQVDADGYGWSWGAQVQAKVDALGQAKFENVVAGEYRLSIGQRMQLVRVPSPPIDFDGRIPDRHRFRLPKRDTPLRSAGVRSGDVFVALDGEALTADTLRTRLQALSSQSTGTLRLTIERDGGKHELVLDASTLAEGKSFNATLEPVLD